MPRFPHYVLALAALTTILVGCGGSGLFATVPPPVEFAGARVAGVNELPPAGTYAGKLTIDSVDYRYAGTEENGEWILVSSTPISDTVNGEATVDSQGLITLRDKASGQTFSGSMKVSNDPSEPVPTVTLLAPDGSSALYPYVLRRSDETTITISAHGKVQGARTARQRFVRYFFDLTAVQ